MANKASPVHESPDSGPWEFMETEAERINSMNTTALSCFFLQDLRGNRARWLAIGGVAGSILGFSGALE
ncbi:hypothetical protein NHX12_023348 [Muraenolepis orangiensis]|uniref:Uncharacterized protein n=1 Tax=Muraenolepis orangiensis TaxID=630683 RepID=A0A9Q0ISQ1_9TELE|nr:hypothetical protein NHX12_023348 [Muraenolepis orangiensis]